MICQNCSIREGNMMWTESTLHYSHGIYQMWCQLCVAKAQLQNAIKLSNTIPELEQRIRTLEATQYTD